MRRGLVVVLLVVLCSGVASAQAAPPPTLTGVGINHSSLVDISAEKLTCLPNPDGGATIRISFGATVEGEPYPGERSPMIELAIGPRQGPSPDRNVLALSGTFSIDSPQGQVSARLSLLPLPPGSFGNRSLGCADPSGYPGPVDLDATFAYTATITTSDGVFVDRGRGEIHLFRNAGGRNPIYDYRQSFRSDLAAPEAVLFGQHTPGSSFSPMSANTKRASPFTLFAPATVRKVFAFVDGKGAASGSQTIRAVLYRSAGGLPAAYVTRSFDFSVPAGMSGRWVPLYLAPPAQLGPGVYWLGIQSGTTNGIARFAWNSKPNARRFNVDAFADGSSEPFGSALADDQQLSTFAAGSY